MAAQKPDQPDESHNRLGRIAEFHPGVLSVSGLGQRPDRSVAAVDATADPQPATSAAARVLPLASFQRMSNWLRRLLPI